MTMMTACQGQQEQQEQQEQEQQQQHKPTIQFLATMMMMSMTRRKWQCTMMMTTACQGQ